MDMEFFINPQYVISFLLSDYTLILEELGSSYHLVFHTNKRYIKILKFEKNNVLNITRTRQRKTVI